MPPDYSRLSYTLSSLTKFGHFNLTVLCYTNAGDGPRSEPLELITEQDVPGAVGAVSFDQVLFSSVVVTWTPPVELNGIIISECARVFVDTQVLHTENIIF